MAFTFDLVIAAGRPRGSGRLREAPSVHLVEREADVAAKLYACALAQLPG